MIVGFDGSRAFVKNRTGTENYSYQLLRHLAKIDKENEYIVYLRPENCHPRPERGSIINNHWMDSRLRGNDNFEWPKNFKFEILNFKRLWTQVGLSLQTFKDPLDILFTPAHTLPLIRKPGLKTVMTVHDLGAEYLPGMHQLKQRIYLGFITRFQLKTASRLIAVSKATKQDLVDKVGVSTEKIEVIYEGLVTPEVKENDVQVDIKKQFDIEKGKYFLFVGTIQPRKNLSRLIEAFSKIVIAADRSWGRAERRVIARSETGPCPKSGEEQSRQEDSLSKIATLSSKARNDGMSELKLAIVGGKGWLSDEIYALPKKLGVEERVKFLGRVDDEYLPELYKNAAGFTYPSLYEGFGLPILEAFSYNCPVLTSNTSSMPEVAGKAAVLIDPYSIDNISEGLKVLLDAKQRKELVKLGKDQLKKFSWEKAARETLGVFKQINKLSS